MITIFLTTHCSNKLTCTIVKKKEEVSCQREDNHVNKEAADVLLGGQCGGRADKGLTSPLFRVIVKEADAALIGTLR